MPESTTWRQGRLAPAVVGAGLLLMTGCAHTSVPTQPDGADPLRALAQRIAAISELPDSAVMDPAVQLVTFRYRSPSADGLRRDTVRTAGAVARWLLALHSAQLPASEFLLATEEVFACHDATVQRGTYRLATGDVGRPITSQPFLARWVDDGAGGWLLDQLWLDPPSGVRVAGLGSRCRGVRRIHPDLAGRRFLVVVEAGTAGDPAGEAMSGAMREAGWTGPATP